MVLELLLGIVIGPHVLGLHPGQAITFFSDLGLGLLFFFAGYEIDVRRILGGPLRLGVLGWVMSLALAYGIGGALAATGVVLSLLYTGSALATTAIGMLIPILSDTGDLDTGFGTYLLGAGAAGEFGPILLVTLVLSAQSTLHNAPHPARLRRPRDRGRGVRGAFRQPHHAAVRQAPWRAARSSPCAGSWCSCSRSHCWPTELGLDLLLGGFAAGLITRQMLVDSELPGFDSKLTAVAFGVFVPFFFIASGMKLDVSALFESWSGRGEDVHLPGAVPGREGHPRAGALPPRARAPRPDRARPAELDPAAAGAGDHHARDQQRATCVPRPRRPWSARRCSRR